MELKKNGIVNAGAGQQYGRKSTFIQFVLCIISNSSVISSGMTLGFSAVVLPYMMIPNDVLYVTPSEGSWIASLATISTPIGCLMIGPIIDYLGRKTGILFVNVPAIIGWLCITIQPSLIQLYIGRLLTGIACGLSSVPSTVYMAESSTAAQRGYLMTGTSIAISLGVAIVYILGLIFQENWKMVAAICCSVPVVSSILIIFFLPESPLWLMSHKKPDKAKESLMVLRATKNPSVIQTELDEITQRVKNNRKKQTFISVIKAVARPECYKPLLIMNTFFLFQQLTGIFVVIFYAVDVVREAGVTADPFVIAVLIGLTRLIFTLFAAWMSRRFGRRVTAIVSGMGMTISLMILATLVLIQLPQLENDQYKIPLFNKTENLTDYEDSISSLNITGDAGSGSDTVDKPPTFLPVIAILIYILSSTVGFLTLPWSMIGEVYPVQIRGVGSGFTTCMTYVFSFFTIKLYPTMIFYMQKHGVFYFYGTMALLGTIFVYFFLPETQGKTLAEIENIFTRKRKRQHDIEEEEALSSTKMVTIVPAGSR
ncbi:uncharacterized protein [Halyomorpha halys]|nr:sugar transporter ERD6-like 6 isoform X2 [Halyomorpha halys]XP_014287870.1 sugar transporter ERD6-like 6 isoform X2 [Halyomorpha halys]XP_014287871.1 sugar transporter ERD6-like 6 isoform X2 [Halyomorpha halys]